MNELRIGCVKYLNARPLIHGWPGPVVFDHPAALCQRLARGELDLALVSSFEFLRNPGYQVVDGISIASDGPVYSVFVAHGGRFSELEEIEIDPASQTSVNLLRCLLEEAQARPRLISRSAAVMTPRSGRMLIGDQAIQFRQRHENEFNFWDLGEQWKKLVALPFVYALWLLRPNITDASKIAARLRALRDYNLANLDQLIAREEEFDPEFCAGYYRKHVEYDFAAKEKNGFSSFAKLCAKHGLLQTDSVVLKLV